MRIVLVGAGGTIGKFVAKRLSQHGHEVIPVGRSSGAYQVKMEARDSVRALYKSLGGFDAVAVAAGEVAFKPVAELSAQDWERSLGSKFLGQVHLVQEALPYIHEGGSFTLVSGVLAREPIAGSAAASAVNRAVEGFVMAAAPELPKRLRINVISPTVLTEALDVYGPYFPGWKSVAGAEVADAYLKAIAGTMTGNTFEV